MVTDETVLKSAWRMLRTSGPDAQREAADYAAALGKEGDSAGQELWQRVARAIGELQNPSA